MAEKIQDTTLSSLADDLASNFFADAGGSNNILLPDADNSDPKEPNKKVNVVTNPVIDFDTTELLGDFLKDDDDEPVIETAPDGTDDKKPVGRPRKDDVDFDSFISEKVLSPFDDDAPIKSFTDLKELIKANRAADKETAKTEALESYKENLPEAVKMILDYTENGGGDVTEFFKALGQARQVSDLDPERDFDRKEIIRQYYQTQGWTPEEVDEEIESLLDIGEDKLKNVALKLKPKLDRLQQEVIEAQIEQGKVFKQQQEQAQAFYVKNVVDVLKTGALGEIKITKQEQKDIYSALVEERYPTASGGQTNRLGAILDKIQFVEPNYALLAEVTMFLSDPEAFKTKIREQIKQEVTADTIRKVKSEQGLKNSGSAPELKDSKGKVKRLDSTFRNPFA